MTEEQLQEIERALDILRSAGSGGDCLFSFRGTELRHSHVRNLIADVRRLRNLLQSSRPLLDDYRNHINSNYTSIKPFADLLQKVDAVLAKATG